MWFERGCATSNLDSFAVWRDFVLPRAHTNKQSVVFANTWS